MRGLEARRPPEPDPDRAFVDEFHDLSKLANCDELLALEEAFGGEELGGPAAAAAVEEFMAAMRARRGRGEGPPPEPPARTQRTGRSYG